MENFNVNSCVDHKIKWADKGKEHFTELKMFGGSVGDNIKKMNIKHSLETIDHKFDGGDIGQRVKKLVIEVDFNDVILQPHSDTAESICSELVEGLAQELSGYYENCQEGS